MRTFDLSEKGHKHTFPVKHNIHAEHTGIQQLEIVDLHGLGKTLVLDNIIQLSELDDAKYHEMMVHPAVASLCIAKKSLVVGGGDGCLVRELLKHSDMEVSLVEIDAKVIEASCRYLSSMNNHAFDSERCKIYLEDVCTWIKQCDDKYDAVFLDITDPQHDTPSAGIITDEILGEIRKRMRPSGILIVQADNPDICPEQGDAWRITLSRHFQNIQTFGVPCLSYGSAISFVAASNGLGVTKFASFPDDLELRWLNQDRLKAGFSLYGRGNDHVQNTSQ
tara:strand:- start:17207 stop:18040 length:834 start_codon:yes stop_codon:yes gene_type:complete